MRQYLKQLLLAIDQLLNVALCNGYADETVSSLAYRMERDGKRVGKLFRPIIDKLFWFEPKHCYTSYLQESSRSQLPLDFK